jgi:hypothetical protein
MGKEKQLHHGLGELYKPKSISIIILSSSQSSKNNSMKDPTQSIHCSSVYILSIHIVLARLGEQTKLDFSL